MTEVTLEAIRGLIREELNVLRTDVAAIRHDVDGIRADPNIAGIPLLQRAVAKLQADVADMRADLMVASAAWLRLDRTRDRHEELLSDILREIRTMNERGNRMSERLRKLEDAE
jgi:hypothetical protein